MDNYVNTYISTDSLTRIPQLAGTITVNETWDELINISSDNEILNAVYYPNNTTEEIFARILANKIMNNVSINNTGSGWTFKFKNLKGEESSLYFMDKDGNIFNDDGREVNYNEFIQLIS